MIVFHPLLGLPVDAVTPASSALVAPLSELAQWMGPHSIKAGQSITKGDALFMRADTNEPAPEATAAS